jgi:hypothetical protein
MFWHAARFNFAFRTNLQIASCQFIPAPWTPPAIGRNIASRLTGGDAMKTIETKRMTRKALTSSAILLGAIFTILLLPAYGQQEMDPTWYDPSPVAVVVHSAQPVAAIQSMQLQTATDDSQATMKSAAHTQTASKSQSKKARLDQSQRNSARRTTGTPTAENRQRSLQPVVHDVSYRIPS